MPGYSLFNSNWAPNLTVHSVLKNSPPDRPAPLMRQQSLFSGPGPSPLERLLEQQRQLRGSKEDTWMGKTGTDTLNVCGYHNTSGNKITVVFRSTVYLSCCLSKNASPFSFVRMRACTYITYITNMLLLLFQRAILCSILWYDIRWLIIVINT